MARESLGAAVLQDSSLTTNIDLYLIIPSEFRVDNLEKLSGMPIQESTSLTFHIIS